MATHAKLMRGPNSSEVAEYSIDAYSAHARFGKDAPMGLFRCQGCNAPLHIREYEEGRYAFAGYPSDPHSVGCPCGDVIDTSVEGARIRYHEIACVNPDTVDMMEIINQWGLKLGKGPASSPKSEALKKFAARRPERPSAVNDIEVVARIKKHSEDLLNFLRNNLNELSGDGHYINDYYLNYTNYLDYRGGKTFDCGFCCASTRLVVDSDLIAAMKVKDPTLKYVWVLKDAFVETPDSKAIRFILKFSDFATKNKCAAVYNPYKGNRKIAAILGSCRDYGFIDVHGLEVRCVVIDVYSHKQILTPPQSAFSIIEEERIALGIADDEIGA